MTPKQWIKYVKRIEKHNLAICDGISEPNAPMSMVYPLLIASGILFIGLPILVWWDKIKLFIWRGKE